MKKRYKRVRGYQKEGRHEKKIILNNLLKQEIIKDFGIEIKLLP